MKDTIVLYPSPGIGHLLPMVELGKLISTHYSHSFTITILITTTSPYNSKISKTTPNIHFHYLPTITTTTTSSKGQPPPIFEILRLNNPHVQQALQSISLTSTVRSFIFDFFCYVSLEITSQLHIPSYIFLPSGASVLAALLYFPTQIPKIASTYLHNTETTLLNYPGLPPIPASDLPLPFLPHNFTQQETFKSISHSFAQSRGMIVNTFSDLEERSIRAIRDGSCIPGSTTPPLYCLGPLISQPESTAEMNHHECLTWLKSQPSRSVVFLSFGSEGVFSAAQINEIAVGLERSGQRFLWVVRSARQAQDTGNRRNLADHVPDFELGELLPAGFLGRTRDMGLVVKDWAPQVEVLSHDSVGGFVTHCGWNSVLESVCAGVPMVGWPLYAEQRLNRFLLVEEMKLALPMVEESEGGFVSCEEVEKRIRMLMEMEVGRELRARVLKAQEKGKAALSEGGSSLFELGELVKSWKV